MAKKTNKSLRNMVMYSIFVRQYSEEGSFKKVQSDLDRIKNLGVDVIWLMPIHPIGKKNRKGSLGSPYAIKDYRCINPEFGSLEDFKELVDAIHSRGMKCIIDVVYNHTSPDSWLLENHPEWFYKRKDGSFGNKVGDWYDVVDLDYTNPGLWDYLIDTLLYWAKFVDGFRCDVAPLIPLDFWLKAREAVAEIRPDCLWLSESVEPSFIVENRAHGMVSLSDSEVFQAFDVCYEYDIYPDFIAYLRGESTLQNYADKVNMQEYIYPENYVKLRYLENHDRSRAKLIIPDEKALRNWTAFIYFQKGMTLLYAGQEKENIVRPTLFDKDVVDWNTGYDLTPLMQRLYRIKKNSILTNSKYFLQDAGNGVLLGVHDTANKKLIGVFSTKGNNALVKVPAYEGIYTNLIDGNKIYVSDGMLASSGEPIIFEIIKEE